MWFISLSEATEIAEASGLGLRPHQREEQSAVRRSQSLEILSSSRHLAFAIAACHWVAHKNPSRVLLCVTEHGIWNEHRQLEATLRERVDNSATLEEKPGLIVGPSDLDFLVSYVFVALAFGWGLVMLDSTGGRWFECNHDGKVWVGSSDPEAVEEAKVWLDWE